MFSQCKASVSRSNTHAVVSTASPARCLLNRNWGSSVAFCRLTAHLTEQSPYREQDSLPRYTASNPLENTAAHHHSVTLLCVTPPSRLPHTLAQTQTQSQPLPAALGTAHRQHNCTPSFYNR